MKPTLLLGTLLTGLLLAACTAATPPGSATPAPPSAEPSGQVDLQGAWELEEGTSAGQPIPIIEGRRITLTIEGSIAGGTAACNGYGGTVTVTGDEVGFSQLSQTEMACAPPEVMVAEQRYLTALGAVHTAARQREGLVLTGVGAELRFRLQPPVPEAALVDTEWILDSLIDGEAASSTNGEGSLELRSDGTFVASTGCRTLTGRYIIYGDSIQVTEMAAEGECPPELADQDSHVIGAIEGPFTVQIDGRTLTITSPGNQGLSFRAPD